MEAGQVSAPARGTRLPAWVAGALPLAILALAIGLFVALGAPGLERSGVPVEELAVERAELRPGEIELTVRNDGPDPVAIRQVIVNDAFVDFEQGAAELGRLEGGTVTAVYPWVEGEAYEIALVTATGGTVAHSVEVATRTPSADAGFYGLMALVGVYVGVIPVAIGMLWLPFVRRVDRRWIRFLLALTIGLLGWLGVDALLEGTELAAGGAQAFGGAGLVFLGVLVAYLALAGADGLMRRRRERARSAGASAWRLATLVAVGIGLHNLGEGLAIGSAYAIGSLALGATLIVGFALHNTTEGLAIVATAADGERLPRATALRRFVGLGLLAGAPAILGAWIGASAFNPSVAAFMFGLGAGAIAQVIVQLAPSIRDATNRLLHPLAVGGVLTGVAVMYTTSLLISV
jgi:zinc transporter ZupT